jgi:glycine/D-amino acid oxidase-like deaminating enzyme
MAGKLGQRAVVVGASVAGLIAARVLAEHFDEVTAIEQDELSDQLSSTNRSRRATTYTRCWRAASK